MHINTAFSWPSHTERQIVFVSVRFDFNVGQYESGWTERSRSKTGQRKKKYIYMHWTLSRSMCFVYTGLFHGQCVLHINNDQCFTYTSCAVEIILTIQC